MPDGLHSATEFEASRAKTKAKFSSRNVSTLYKAPSAVMKCADGFQGGTAGTNRLLVLRPPARGPLAASKANAVAAPTPINTPSLRKEHQAHDMHVRPLASSKVGWGGENQDHEHSEQDHQASTHTESRQHENSDVISKPKAWGSPVDARSNQVIASPTLNAILPLASSGRWGDDAVEEDLLQSEIQREMEHEREFPDLHQAVSNNDTYHRHHHGQPAPFGHGDERQYFDGPRSHFYRNGYYAHDQYNAYHDDSRYFDRHSDRAPLTQPRYAAHDVNGRHEYYPPHRHHVSYPPRALESNALECTRHFDHGVAHVPRTHTHFGPQDARFDYMFQSNESSQYDAGVSRFSRFENHSAHEDHRPSSQPCDQRRGVRIGQDLSCGRDETSTNYGNSHNWRRDQESNEPQQQAMLQMPSKSCVAQGQPTVELPLEKRNVTTQWRKEDSPAHRISHAASRASSVWTMSEAEVASTRGTHRGAEVMDDSGERRVQASVESGLGAANQVRILKRTGPRMLFDPKSGTMINAEAAPSRPQKTSREYIKRVDEENCVEAFCRESSSKRSSRRNPESSGRRVGATKDAGSQSGKAYGQRSQQHKVSEGFQFVDEDSTSVNSLPTSAANETTNTKDSKKTNESMEAPVNGSSKTVSQGDDVPRRRLRGKRDKDRVSRNSAGASSSTSMNKDTMKNTACTLKSVSTTLGPGEANIRVKGARIGGLDGSTRPRCRQSQVDLREVTAAPRAARSRRLKTKISPKDSLSAVDRGASEPTVDHPKNGEGGSNISVLVDSDESIPVTTPSKARCGTDVNEIKSITLAEGVVVIDDMNSATACEVQDDDSGFKTMKSRKSILRERRIERERATRNSQLSSGRIVVSTVSSRRGKRALTVTVNSKADRGHRSQEKKTKQSRSARKIQQVEMAPSIRERKNNGDTLTSPCSASARVVSLPAQCITSSRPHHMAYAPSLRAKPERTCKNESAQAQEDQNCAKRLSSPKSDDQPREHVSSVRKHDKSKRNTQRRTRRDLKTGAKASRVYVPKKGASDEAVQQVDQLSINIDNRSRTSSTESASSKSSEAIREETTKGKKSRGTSGVRLPIRAPNGEAKKCPIPPRRTKSARSKDSIAQPSCANPAEDAKRGEAEKQEASARGVKNDRRGVTTKDGTSPASSSQRSRKKMYVVKAVGATSSCSAA